jgi:hypothetical protein
MIEGPGNAGEISGLIVNDCDHRWYWYLSKVLAFILSNGDSRPQEIMVVFERRYLTRDSTEAYRGQLFGVCASEAIGLLIWLAPTPNNWPPPLRPIDIALRKLP